MTKQHLRKPYCFIGMTLILLLFNSQGIYAQFNWKKNGTDIDKYKIGIDATLQHNKQSVMTIKSIESEITGYGGFMQNLKPGDYVGKRVRMTGYMKSKDVSDWAAFWLRVDQADTLNPVVAFDNMQERPVKGTTGWNKYSIVLDVPNNASNIAFGAFLGKTGQIWFSNPVFEIVDKSVSKTGLESKNDSEFVKVTPQSCETEPGMKSINADNSALLRFKNNTGGNITVHWINYSGQRDASADQVHHIAPGKYVDMQTFLTHPFIVIGTGGKCYGIYEATPGTSIAIIND